MIKNFDDHDYNEFNLELQRAVFIMLLYKYVQQFKKTRYAMQLPKLFTLHD